MAVCAAAIGCTTIVTEQLVDYFRYQVKTIDTTVEVSELNFPSVTLCNLNFIKRSYVEEYPYLSEVLKALDPVPGQTETKINTSDPAAAALKDLDVRSALIQGAHTMEDTFLQCSWQSKPFNCSEYFTAIMSDSTVCYTFNSRQFIESHGVLKTTSRGAKGGLSITVGVLQEEYFSSSSYSAGFKARKSLYVTYM